MQGLKYCSWLILFFFISCFNKKVYFRNNISEKLFSKDTTYLLNGDLPLTTEYKNLIIKVSVNLDSNKIKGYRDIRFDVKYKKNGELFVWGNICEQIEGRHIHYFTSPWNYLGYYQVFSGFKKNATMHLGYDLHNSEIDSVSSSFLFVFDMKAFEKSAKVSKKTYRKDLNEYSLIFEEEPDAGYGIIEIENIDLRQKYQNILVNIRMPKFIESDE